MTDNQGAASARPPRPQPLPVREAEIPAELKRWPQWVVWRYEFLEGKWTKPQRQARGGRLARATDRTTWDTFENALTAYQTGEWDGVGFCPSEHDPFVFVDYDDCVQDSALDAAVEPLVRDVTYAEMSPSRGGVRQVLKGQLPGRGRKQGNVEVYDRGHYLTLTGRKLRMAPAEIRDDQQHVERLYELVRKPTHDRHDRGARDHDHERRYGVHERGGRIRELFGRLNSEGMSLELIIQAVLEENAKFFDPPKSEQEVRDEVTEQWRQYGDQNGQAPAGRGGTVDTGTAEPEPERPTRPVPVYPIAAWDHLAPLLEAGQAAGLPSALLGGGMLAAAATAVGPLASIAGLSWDERAILWVPLLGPRGTGKSPAQDVALAPLREHDNRVFPGYRQAREAWLATPVRDRSPRPPRDPTVLVGDLTLESLARLLQDRPGLGADVDELQSFIRGLGQYKHEGGADRGLTLALWSGAPWRFTRVGSGGSGLPAVDIHVPQPQLVIVGGLQPALHGLLGGDEDGLRPRWLPHLVPATPTAQAGELDPGLLRFWEALLVDDLLACREESRRWQLTPAAQERFAEHQQRWKLAARDPDSSASLSAALLKGDRHLLRVALVLAETGAPGRGGSVEAEVVDRAAALVDFSLECWRALPENDTLSLSAKTARLDRAVDRLRAWLEEHGGQATRRELLRGHVAGVRTVDDLAALLRRYEAVYPGTVRQEPTPGRGPGAEVVHAP